MRPPNDPGIKQWVGESMKLRRIAANLTMDDLAEAVGVTKSTIKRWEHGENAPPPDMLQIMCKVLGGDTPLNPNVFARMPRIS